MKKQILLVALLALALLAFSQETPKFAYCQIVGHANMMGTKVTVEIDYGDPKRWAEDTRLRDAEGKLRKFNSMIDALNYMGKQGWEFEQAYTVTMGNTNVYHYLMKKPFEDLDENIQKIIMGD